MRVTGGMRHMRDTRGSMRGIERYKRWCEGYERLYPGHKGYKGMRGTTSTRGMNGMKCTGA